MVIYQDFPYWPDGNKNRRLHIWLPDDYDESDERYPVMYMFDGHNLFYDEMATYGKCWGLAEFMEQWDRKLIIVGMECSHEGHNRLNEYCPYTGRDHRIRFTGKGVQTFQWIINDVKPFIDENFRTLPDRSNTAVAGSSMGGIMSVYGVIHHNEVFSRGICVSAMMQRNLADYRKTLSEAEIGADTRIYISWGEKEVAPAPAGKDNATESSEAIAAYRLESELKQRGASTLIYCQPEGEHCERDWEKQNPLFMDFIWK